MITAALPTYSLNAIRENKVTCPECGARQTAAVTNWEQRRQVEIVHVEFDCEHGRVVGTIKKGKR